MSSVNCCPFAMVDISITALVYHWKTKSNQIDLQVAHWCFWHCDNSSTHVMNEYSSISMFLYVLVVCL